VRWLVLALVLLTSSLQAEVAKPPATPGAHFLVACKIMVAEVADPSTEWDLNSAYFSGLCMGAIVGTVQMNDMYRLQLRDKAYFCPQGYNISPLIVAKLLSKYEIADFPEEYHDNPISMIVLALAKEYPCLESIREAVKRFKEYEGITL
jgi:hypothetical protein